MTKEIFADDMKTAEPFVQQAINDAEARGERLSRIVYQLPSEKFDGTRVMLIFEPTPTRQEINQ